jgi:ATP-dependent RNA helicase DeaD
MTTNFVSIGIREEFDTLLKKHGITIPTPVQENSIPVLRSGKDAIVQAQTGTGKTLAFILPILEKIQPDLPKVQALVVTPTRELAIQITAEAKKLAPAVGIGVLAVYGGQDVEAQIHKLKGGTQLIIATPGRLLDHSRRGTVDLSHVRMLVLDEADQMLELGFLPEVEDILRKTPASRRQTMLFSATMPDQVRHIAKQFMKSPENIRIQGKKVTLEEIRQLAVETTDRARQATLFKLIEDFHPYLAVVFCRTKIRAKKLTEALIQHGFQADELHGDLSQSKRESVMKKFRDAKLQILVATDVAARGLDVEGVTHVFNYDVPTDTDWYIHRIGRTGRAGQRGVAVTLISQRDRAALQNIERKIGMTIEKHKMDENDSGPVDFTEEKTKAGTARRKPQGSRGPGAQTRSADRSGNSRGKVSHGKGRRDDKSPSSRRSGTSSRNKTSSRRGR